MANEAKEIKDYQPGSGQPIVGIASRGAPRNRFLANIAVGELLRVAPDQQFAENEKLHYLDARLESVQDLREQIQRVFESAKKKNVEAYSKYLIRLATDKNFNGDVPPIKLYSKEELDVALIAGQSVIVLPYDVTLVAYDGETQLAAWHQAARENKEVLSHYVDISIAHGLPVEWAKQSFHDMNMFGIKPNATLSIYMDSRDPLNEIAKELATKFFPGQVEEQRRQASAKSNKLFTIAALRLFVVCLADGSAGVVNATRPVPYEGNVEMLRARAEDWMGQLIDKLPGDGLKSRESIFTVPPMLAALGALGHDFGSVEALRHAEWKRDAVAPDGRLIWDGIAGKQGGKGDIPTLAVGGPKEYVHSCFRALVPGKPEYDRITGGVLVGAQSV